MTTTRTLTIEHDGKVYSGQPARIDKTSLGWEDHGILTAYLHCSWAGGGISVGGFCLDSSTGAPDYSRRGTAYGLDHLMRIMETVGVTGWEKLPGQQVIVLFETEPGGSTWGMQAAGIAALIDDRIFICKAHAEEWLDAADA